jgi:hypothetical protein
MVATLFCSICATNAIRGDMVYRIPLRRDSHELGFPILGIYNWLTMGMVRCSNFCLEVRIGCLSEESGRREWNLIHDFLRFLSKVGEWSASPT